MHGGLVFNVSDGQVLPRSARDAAALSAASTGRELSLLVSDGCTTWTARGRDKTHVVVPTGGPYRMEATARDTADSRGERLQVSDVYVGDIWVLAGQSNMQGVAPISTSLPTMDRARLLGFDGSWQPAIEPLHRLYSRQEHPLTRLFLAIDERNEPGAAQRWGEHHDHDGHTPIGGLGPGSAFARELAAASGVPIGLLPCALGGSTLEMWNPGWGADFEVPADACLFAHMVDQITRYGPARGVLWYQGETDALLGTHPSYGPRFEAFVESVRSAVGQPALPFLTVQLASCDFHELEGSFPTEASAMAVAWTTVRDHQRLAARHPGVELVTAADCGRFDAVHLDESGAERVGRRLARLAAGHTPDHPRPHSATPALRAVSQEGTLRIRCSFDGVTGQLHLQGRCAFGVATSGRPGPSVVRVHLDGSDAVVLELDAPLVERAELTYGSPWDIGCGLVDDLDMAVPAFGPVEVAAVD